MSLLIKALKQAEKRHQEATAAVFESAPAEPAGDPMGGASDAAAAPGAGPARSAVASERRAESVAAAIAEIESAGAMLAGLAAGSTVEASSAASSATPSASMPAAPAASAATAAEPAQPGTSKTRKSPASSRPAAPAKSGPGIQLELTSEHDRARSAGPSAVAPPAFEPAMQPLFAQAGASAARPAAMVAPASASQRNSRIYLWSGVAAGVFCVAGWLGWQSLSGTPGSSSMAGGIRPPYATPGQSPNSANSGGAPGARAGMQPPPAESGPASRSGSAASSPTDSTIATASPVATASTVAPAPDDEPTPRARSHPGGRSKTSAKSAGTAQEPLKTALLAPPDRVTPPSRPARGLPQVAAAGAAAAHASAFAPGSAPGASPIRLARTEASQDRIARLLDEGYAALGQNNRNAARALYEQVIELDQNSADAWIGLATLAARAGEVAQAERLYGRALEIDPNDATARAGMMSLRGTGDATGQESQLRNLIAQDPSQAASHFALGNALAAQGRWPEAQQSYFNAQSIDPMQPDYAFNLAISLERVKQPQAAAGYYKRALQLADEKPSKFTRAQAQARLAALDSTGAPK